MKTNNTVGILCSFVTIICSIAGLIKLSESPTSTFIIASVSALISIYAGALISFHGENNDD